MSRTDVRPLSDEFLPDAGRLLAARHARHRAAEPLLSARYEDPEVAQQLIADALAAEGASGTVAVSGGRVTGYMLGVPRSDDTWGPNIWVESDGFASEDAETVRDLYGHAAARWVDEGRTAHYAIVPSHNEDVLRAWYRVGFGQQHMHAVQPARTEPFAPPGRLVIRRAERPDIPDLAALEVALPQHQGLSPVFSSGHLPTLEEAVSEWEGDFDDPAYAVFVAERDGVVVGSAIGCSLEKSGSNSGLIRPDSAGFLGFAAVYPEHRGLGAGRALGERVIAWSTEAGYDCIATDWRVTNLLSSRAWPALGFRETFVRVHRVVGY